MKRSEFLLVCQQNFVITISTSTKILLMDQKSRVHQLRLVVFPVIYKVFSPSKTVVLSSPDFWSHQHLARWMWSSHLKSCELKHPAKLPIFFWWTKWAKSRGFQKFLCLEAQPQPPEFCPGFGVSSPSKNVFVFFRTWRCGSWLGGLASTGRL